MACFTQIKMRKIVGVRISPIGILFIHRFEGMDHRKMEEIFFWFGFQKKNIGYLLSSHISFLHVVHIKQDKRHEWHNIYLILHSFVTSHSFHFLWFMCFPIPASNT